MSDVFQYSPVVKRWLFFGLCMVFIQIIVGGITRLTESGLSITEWDVVYGIVPPFTEASWNNEFELYKHTPQYKEINEGMSLSDFKFIYFWEYIHRFWARLIAFTFIIPFGIFLYKKKIDKVLIFKLGKVVLMGIVAATVGWIMVASGLINRPWVNAYKLSLHLCIALGVYVFLLLAWLHTINYDLRYSIPRSRLLLPFMLLIWVQMFLGGMMSGMKAAVYFPEWPMMQGSFLPTILLDSSQWNWDNFNYYDQTPFVPSLTQFLHRMNAYVIFIIGIFLTFQYWRVMGGRKIVLSIFLVLSIQVLLGILTLLNSVGEVPVSYGVAHQGMAVLLLSLVYLLWYRSRSVNN